jgi:hypothetical protein
MKKHREYMDDSEVYKLKSFRSMKRMRIAENILFVVLCIMATMMILFFSWVYF